MADKDIAERALLSHNDVFAHAVNALLLGGASIVHPEDLEDAHARTSYTSPDGRLKDQERDVVKHWKGGANVRVATLGIENQSSVDNDMVLRVLAYDAAAYRDQVGTEEPRYPVVTIVLYFGSRPWSGPTCLLDRLDIPESLRGLVADWPLHIFDMGRLSAEQRNALKGDLRVVADFLYSQATGNLYEPSGETMHHPGDVVRTLEAITGDNTWTNMPVPADTSGKEATMNDVLERYISKRLQEGLERGLEQGLEQGLQQGLEQGLQQGLHEGRAEMLASNIAAVMASFGVDFDQACDALGVDPDNRPAMREAVARQ